MEVLSASLDTLPNLDCLPHPIALCLSSTPVLGSDSFPLLEKYEAEFHRQAESYSSACPLALAPLYS
jgi:hypothetical protein